MEFLKNISLSEGIALPNKKVKLAVTGLSRSGKTIFITSLINQLIAGDKLEFLKRKTSKLFITRIKKNSELETFKYEDFLKNLRAKKPIWPESTSDISSLTLELEVKSTNRVLKNRFIDIELIDYPGEWLLDIPMLNQTYEQWSEFCFNLAKKEPRDKLSFKWLSMLHALDFRENFNDDISKELSKLYREYLFECKDSKAGLNLIQPGRFIMPGDMSGELLEFTPLPPIEDTTNLDENSYYMIYKKRYEKYVNDFVRKFNLEHFSKFDRQIVLVDVLKALKTGYECFEDMVESIKMIMSIYSYGRVNFISQFFSNKIDKVIFCATKADHVANNQHNNYRSLLELIIEEARRQIDIKGVKTASTIVSSVKSTHTVLKEYDGRRLSCLKGRVLGESEDSIIYPGEVPEYFPSKEDWDLDYFDFPSFAPVSFPTITTQAVSNIRMDEVIYHLIGDKI